MNILIIQLTGQEMLVAGYLKERGSLKFISGSRQELIPADFSAALPAHLNADTRVILAIPPGQLFFRELSIPLEDRKKLRELLPLELKGEIALENESLLFDAMPLANGKKLAVWTPLEPLKKLIATLAEAGIEPEIVTSSLFSWDRLLPSGNQETVAISDGESFALFQAGTPLFFRAFASGSIPEQLARTVAALQLKEVRIDRLLLHGAATPNQFPDLPFPVEMLPLNSGITQAFGDDKQASQDLAGTYAIAQSSALGEPINFRSGPLAYTRKNEQLQRKLRITAVLALVVILLLFGELGVRYFLIKKDLTSLDTSIRKIYSEVFPTRKKPVDEVSELKSEIKRLSGSKAAGSILTTLKQLALAKGDDITGIYELEIDGDQVRGKGDARTAQAASDFKGKTSAILANTEISEIKSRPDGSTGFSFRGTLREVNK